MRLRKGMPISPRAFKRFLLPPLACLLLFLILQVILVRDLNDWEPGSDRFASSYISQESESVLVFPRVLSRGQRLDILGVIHSDPSHFEHRDVIRRTWLADMEEKLRRTQETPSFKAVFLLGSSSRLDSPSQKRLQSEADFYGDVIVEDFEDSYNNLTLKSILMLKFVVKYDLQIKYLFKIDDDAYLNVERYSELMNMSSSSICGHKFPQASPIRYSTIFSYDKKWICPRWMYEEDTFPPYVAGPGYIIPGERVPTLLTSAFQIPFIHLEDVFITGIVAERSKIPRKGLKSFGERNPNICLVDKEPSSLLFHPVPPTDMQRIHKLIKTTRLC